MSRKILCLVITRMVAGGAQKIVLDLISELDAKDFEIHLISGEETGSEGSFWPQCEDLLDGAHLHRVPELVRAPSIFKDRKAIRILTQLFKTIRPNIVHSHTSKAGIIARLAAHRARVPKIMHSTHGLIYDPRAKIPGVTKGLMLRCFLYLDRKVGKMTHHLITLSEQETGDAMTLKLAEPSRIQSIHNGIPLVEFAKIEREVTNWKVPHLRLGIAGRLASEKGHGLLFRSFRRLLQSHPNVSLKVAGDGPLRAELESLTQELGLSERVMFLGYQNDMVAFLKEIDIFVLSSHYEGFGLVLVEAMAAGLPVVATDVGGVREVLVDGKTGIVVPSGSEEELAMGIDYFIRHPHLAYRYGQDGRQHAMDKFSRQQMIKRHIEMYRKSPKVEGIAELEGYVPVDLHMHSCHSFDSKTQVDVVLDQALRRGVKAISITDHDNLEGSLEAMAKAPAGLMVVPGMEITSEVGDIIALFIHKPIEAVDLEGIVREVRAQDGLLYLPHPFRGRRSLSLELVKNMDVFEVLNGRSQGIDYNNDQFGDAEIVQFAQEYGLCGMGGSDAHKSHEQHRVLTYVPDFEDLEELKAHLRSGVVFPIWKDNDWWAESLEASGHPAFQS